MGDAKEDTLGKYKRLLSLARSNLEANQASLAEKDKQIAQLRSALEDVHRGKMSLGTKEDESRPKHLSRRINVDGRIWVLVEYDQGEDDKWLAFTTEDELDDFVARLPGVPLEKPATCLTVQESVNVETEAQRKVERIVEEFRRYKVRAEIARKQKAAEHKLAHSTPSKMTVGGGTERSAADSLGTAMSEGTEGYMGGVSAGGAGGARGGSASSTEAMDEHKREVSRLRNQMSEQDERWRAEYEKVVRENELLKSGGGEAMLAQQWRERFEGCQAEKEVLAEKLAMFFTPSSSGGVESLVGGAVSIERAFMDLRAENKDLRRKLGLGSSSSRGGRRGKEHERANSDEAVAPSDSGPLASAKIQYLRQLLYKYLTCAEVEVKLHMETALTALLRFTEAEKRAVEARRKSNDESIDPLGISDAIGSIFTAATS